MVNFDNPNVVAEDVMRWFAGNIVSPSEVLQVPLRIVIIVDELLFSLYIIHL